MKKLKWLLEIADQKPLLFSILLLIVAIGYLSDIAINRDKDIAKCNEINRQLQQEYERKSQEREVYYRNREALLNDEVKNTLGKMIQYYQDKVKEQRELYEKIDSTIKENKRLLNSK